jgi:ATP-dependent DNA helicase RecG
VVENSIIFNLVENMGTGINKIKNLCADYNIKEPEFVFNDFFTVIFKRLELNEEINEVLLIIKNNPRIKAFPISTHINKPKKTIDRYFKKLKDLGLIEYRGSNKTGGYYAWK